MLTYYEKNKDKIREQRRIYYKKNKIRIDMYHYDYISKNKHKFKAYISKDPKFIVLFN